MRLGQERSMREVDVGEVQVGGEEIGRRTGLLGRECAIRRGK